MYWAARNCYEQGHYIDSEKLWREELESRKVVMGDDHMDTINVRGTQNATPVFDIRSGR